VLHHKLAVGGIVVGLAIGGLGLADHDDPTPHTVSPPPPTATDPNRSVIESIGPNEPIDDVVAMWAQRAEDQPLDYLSRTQLGRALNRRARERADLADHERAEDAHRAALTLNPDHRPAQLGLIVTAAAQHRFGEARRLAEAVLEDHPNAPDALALAGDASFELGDLDAASAAYARLAEAGVGAPAQLRLARLAAIQVSPTEAAAVVTGVIEDSDVESLSSHDAASMWFQLARHRFDAGDPVAALDGVETALRLDDDHPGATEMRPFVLASIGRTDEALAHYATLVADGAAPDVEGLYADLLRRSGRSAEAEIHEQHAANEAVGLAERYPAERRHLVGYHLTRDPDLAVSMAETDLTERQDVGAHDALAWALFHAGRFQDASAAIGPAVAGPGLDASRRYHAAAIADAVGDHDDARRHLQIALATNAHFHPTEAADAVALAERLGLEVPAS
jgi:tetratricopeptide (TPR) repeat protein